jgi:hypothetical protein
LVEFDGVETLFLSRVIGIEPDELRIGLPVRARFLRNSKFKPTDVYFVPTEAAAAEASAASPPPAGEGTAAGDAAGSV